MTADDLQRFCADTDDPRYYLRQPWTRGGYTWATNGHIIVRVPAIEGVEENQKCLDAETLLGNQRPPHDWVPVPDAMPTDTTDECERCHGSGEHECVCGTEHECGECHGTGQVITLNMSGMDIGDSHFQQRYLALIQGWEIAPNGDKPAWIRNGEAMGLLMPKRKP